MPSKNNIIKDTLLGMKHGTASSALRKRVMFSLVCRLELNRCFKCKLLIESVDEFSIEHKLPWQRAADPRATFFDLDNIAFSHLRCNVGSASYERTKKHGGIGRYTSGCRCDPCRAAKAASRKPTGSAKSGD